MDATTAADAAEPVLDLCASIGPQRVGPPSTSAPRDVAIVVDAHGWLLAWTQLPSPGTPGTAVTVVGRPVDGLRPISVMDFGGAGVDASTVRDGTQVCAWGRDGAPGTGRCITIDADLHVVSPPHDVPYGHVLGFARLRGGRHAIWRTMATLTRPSGVQLAPVDEAGMPTGPAVDLPCLQAYSVSWNDELVACVAPAVADWTCDETEPSPARQCDPRLRLVSADGTLAAPELALPAGTRPRVAAQEDGLLVTWFTDAVLHAQPVALDGTPAPEQRMTGARPTDSVGDVIPTPSGYVVAWTSWRDEDPDEPRAQLALLAPDGTPLAPLRWASEAPDPGWENASVVGASSGDAWALAAMRSYIHFRAFGCEPRLGGCADGLVRCMDEDGVARCVDLASEPCHCGACGRSCPDCVGGVCGDCGGPPRIGCGPPVACISWLAGESSYCADSRADATDCGACGHTCATGEACVDGACCAARETECLGGGDADCDGHRGCWGDCDCVGSPACGFADPGTEVVCDDGRDQDLDGLIDCADPDCARTRVCGGAGLCPTIDLGRALPALPTTLFTQSEDATSGTCGGVGQREISYSWAAPEAGRYLVSTRGSGAPPVALYVRDAGCDGAELACSTTGELRVVLRADQAVTVYVEGASSACTQLTIARDTTGAP